jgi:serine/threonine protein phosphatase 1
MKWLLNRASARRPSVPVGERIYAIGDIHGRIDLLDDVLDRVDADAARTSATAATLVFLGDYVDRGPDSAKVLSRLSEVRQSYRSIFLKGNHEWLLSEFLDHPEILEGWAKIGGLETLMSYGLKPGMPITPDQCDELASQLRDYMPDWHRDFLANLPLAHISGDYVFVHAGIRPKKSLLKQTPQDLLWIREDFILYEGCHEKFVVHGHTPIREPEICSNRINIDTGAWVTGKLTCLVLEEDHYRFL